jgi:hypothetical protein
MFKHILEINIFLNVDVLAFDLSFGFIRAIISLIEQEYN